MALTFPTAFTVDQLERLFFVADWAPFTNGREGASSNWLGAGETIASIVSITATNITVAAQAITDVNTSVTISVRNAAANTTAEIAILIETSTGERSKRTMSFQVADR
jgi:hypothetical protein